MLKYYISLFFLLTTFIARAQSSNINSDCDTNPPDFSKLSYEQAVQTLNAEEKKKICPEYITNLVNQLRYRQLNNDNKVFPIYLLGWFRASNKDSIEILIENIDLRVSKIEPLLGPARWGKYPAEEALVRIGKPVVDPILNHLPTENSQLRRQLMCDVLKQVLRHK